MKAIQIHAYGDVDQLNVEEVPDPKPGAGEVLIKTAGTSINPIDHKLRSGVMKQFMPVSFPAIFGRDVAGTVVSLGEGVTGFAMGARVMGNISKGYATLVVAKASDICAIPDGMTDEQAAAVPLVLLTGAQLIEKAAKISAGQTVLVTGALGGVGRAAVFVAKQLGARVLAGVRGSQRKQAEALGADQVIALDDAAAIGALPELDVLADAVGGEVAVKLLPKIKKGGVLATVVGAPKEAQGRDLKIEEMMTQADGARLAALAADVARGRLEIPIARVFRFAEIRDASRFAEKGAGGKVVLVP